MSDEFRELLYALRGVPDHCDFCTQQKPTEELEPEEGGDWVCRDCLAKWETSDAAKRAAGGGDNG